MDEVTKDILDKVPVGVIATVNRDRTPLVTPLHFARWDDKIVWISSPETRHSENVFRNGKIDFVVWDEHKRAIFINTTAGELAEEDQESALSAYRKKHGDFKPNLDKVQIYVAKIGDIDENSTTEIMRYFIA